MGIGGDIVMVGFQGCWIGLLRVSFGVGQGGLLLKVQVLGEVRQ